MNDNAIHCGYVAIVGRPNVGKSTLLNRILGQKVSITARKPQTTRHRILGIKTTEFAQTVYVDTPGLHLGGKKAMNRYMNRAAISAIEDVDVIVFIVDGLKWTEEDAYVLEKIMRVNRPVILAVNKVDKITHKDVLLPHIQKLASENNFVEIIPISALKGDNVEELEQTVSNVLPLSHPLFPEDQITDRSERFLAAELIREKLIRLLGQELPYALTVEIEQFKTEKNLLRISALIWVEREGQKKIIIGKHGEQLKLIGQKAREEMEKLFERKIFLQLWVKVRKGWSDDERALRSLGYGDEF
jgi:GTP-binding protein Era